MFCFWFKLVVIKIRLIQIITAKNLNLVVFRVIKLLILKLQKVILRLNYLVKITH